MALISRIALIPLGGFSPWVYAGVAAFFLAAVGASFAAGMITEARWTTKLLLAEKDKAIAALNERVKNMAEASEKAAQERADREAEWQATFDELIEKAIQNAKDTEALSPGSVDAIDRAGGVQPQR